MNLIPNVRTSQTKKHRKKFDIRFPASPAARHWCFEFIRTVEGPVGAGGTLSLKAQRAKQRRATRVVRCMRRIRERRGRQKKVKKEQNEVIKMITDRPSSVMSAVGSVYQMFNFDKDGKISRRAMYGDVDDGSVNLQKRQMIWDLFKPSRLGPRRFERLREGWDVLYEEHMFSGVRQWPSWNAKLVSTSYRSRVFDFFHRLMAHGRSKTNFTKTEFYLCLLLYEFNISQLINYGHLFEGGGITWTVAMVILVSCLIQLPFNMWIMTMVSYSQSLCLKLFSDCMPVVASVRIPIFFVFILAESRRLMHYEAVMKYLFHTFTTSTWKNCTIPPANKRCVPYNTQTAHNTNCTSRVIGPDYEFFSTQFFVRYNVLRLGDPDDPDYIKYWGDPNAKFYGPALAFLIYMIAINGIAILKNITIKAQIAVMGLATMCIITIAGSRLTMASFEWRYSFVSFEFFLNCIAVTFQINSLPVLMWLSTMKPPDLTPSSACIVLQTVKLPILLILSTAYSTLAYEISLRYRMTNKACFLLQGEDIIFSMVPDSFAMFRFTMFWQCWWLVCLLILVVVYSVYVLMAATESVIQVIPSSQNYASLYMFFILVFTVILRLTNEIPYVFSTMLGFESRGLNHINNFNLLLIIIFMYFLYTPIRMNREYSVLYGKPPPNFWVVTWHFMVFIAVVVGILTVMVLIAADTPYRIQFSIAICYIIISFWTLFCNVAFQATRAVKKNTLHLLCYPSKKWGPPTEAERKKLLITERSSNLPTRGQCRHICFLESPMFNEILKKQVDLLEKIKLAQEGKTVSVYYDKIDDGTVLYFNRTIVG